jgi:hypothetical protein
VQATLPLVIVKVAPRFVQPPALENVIALPEAPPVAPTVKVVSKTALVGACVVTVIAWVAFWAVTVSTTRGAAS